MNKGLANGLENGLAMVFGLANGLEKVSLVWPMVVKVCWSGQGWPKSVRTDQNLSLGMVSLANAFFGLRSSSWAVLVIRKKCQKIRFFFGIK